MNNENVFAYPSKELAAVFIRWFIVVLAAYLLIYYPCNSYAASQAKHYRLYTSWELAIPLVPPMIIIYLSYVTVFFFLVFVIKTPEAIKGLALSMLAMMVISGVIFFFFPGQLGYQRPADVPGYNTLFKLLYTIDQPHNLFPSLHVSFAYLSILAMMRQTQNKRFHLALKIWFAVVCASVILVHQHHLFDIVSGMLLSWVVYRQIYLNVAKLPARAQTQF